jgi:F-type H+-transporting ATPase subunit b
LEGLGINLGYLLVQVFNFLILMMILIAWVYRPLLRAIRERRERIAQGLEDARVAAEARANAEKEAEGILAEAQQEASRIVKEATARAEKVAEEIKQKTEAEAENTRQDAILEAEREKERVLTELRSQVAALAIAAAQKVVGETLDEKRQHSLIQEFFSGVKSGKVVILEAERVRGEMASVTSALPLTDNEKDTVKKDIVKKLGSDADVSFSVDPTILGGLVIRVGDKILDGSVAGKLSGLSQSLE